MIDKYASLLEAIEMFELISVADDKVYGPYLSPSNGRKFVIVVDDKGVRRTVSYPKHIMETHLKKRLDPNLHTIDHIDRNKDNNDLSNLRIVERSQHSKDDTRRVKLIKLKCDNCQKDFERSPRLLRDKSNKGVRGKFCCKSCSSSYSRKVQLGLAKPLPVQPYIESEYYRNLKNIAALGDYYTIKYGLGFDNEGEKRQALQVVNG